MLWQAVSGAAEGAEVSAAHWAFQPIVRPQPPEVSDAAWPRTPIDRFILAKLESRGLVPSSPAEPSVLLRRLSLDLIGLPPDPAEVDAFVAAPTDEAYSAAIERLLASPHYGERWGRHWLDVARYADSAGYEFDKKREIWRYRDWVIAALNQDLPYDQFLVDQIAGDLVPEATREQLVATGFSCNAQHQYRDVHETTTDRVNAFGTAVLGLTLGCASCHDHKFDPISQEEFYQVYAFFNEAEDAVLDFSPPDIVAARDALQSQIEMLKRDLNRYQNGPDPDPVTWAAQLTSAELVATPSEVRQAIIRKTSDRTAEQHELIREHHRVVSLKFKKNLQSRLASWAMALEPEARTALGPDAAHYLDAAAEEDPADAPPGLLAKFWEQDAGRVKRQQVIERLQDEIPATETTHVLRARVDQPRTFVFMQGNHLDLGPEVSPDTPAFLPPLAVDGERPDRLDLARWAVAPNNPLTARAIVNRIWQQYFGRGLVESSEDFGVQAPTPEHRELLDWLASELMARQWSLKHIHRTILQSAVYRQSAHIRPALRDADPENRLLARQSRLRLEAEIIRDAALAVSGLLCTTIGGPSVFPYQPEGVMTGRADQSTWQVSDDADRHRRGLYTHFWRTTPHPFLTLFDAPDAMASCTRRTRSNTPVQALTLLNDPAFVEAAVALGKRILHECPGATDVERLNWAANLCLGRTLTPEELAPLEVLLAQQRSAFAQHPERAAEIVGASDSDLPAPNLAAWTAVSRALLNLDEFLTRE
ncbi:MAG TPA: DUF1549 and DUF1553 domain-containing protein [Lacipirellulaceae bacterium]|nr:DUF1549 and DUF1553 domain-containing protein [Lacipirellulaceae bacterium]